MGGRRLAIATLAAGMAALVGVAAPGHAQTGPHIELDKTTVSPGDAVIVSMYGFTAPQVTLAVCGNLAKRGSSDCNMSASQSDSVRPDGELTLSQLFVQAPPVPCPCIVRVSSSTNDEFAVTPIDILGHPVAPVADITNGPLIEVELDAERVPGSLSDTVGTAIGRSTEYDIAVSVRNITTETLSNVVIRGSGGRSFEDEAATLHFDQPGPIDPGQTWSQTVRAKIPAPAIGKFTWTVDVSGAGETVEADQVTRSNPILLYTLIGILVIDLIVLAVRLMTRGRRRRKRAGSSVDDAWTEGDSAETVEQVLVG